MRITTPLSSRRQGEPVAASLFAAIVAATCVMVVLGPVVAWLLG